MKDERKYYPFLDLVKFICALLVVIIHSGPKGSSTSGGFEVNYLLFLGQASLNAVLRIAVPIFFVLSSFLLFKKINSNPSNKWKYVGQFSLRIMYLYVFWYILGLPKTLLTIREYILSGDTYSIAQLVVQTLVKGAPSGYWYLFALVIGVIIIASIKDKKSLVAISILSSVFYLLGCLFSTYFGIFDLSDNLFFTSIKELVKFLSLNICLLQGLLFILFGKLFADKGTHKIKGNLVFVILAFLLVISELFMTLSLNLFREPDACLTLPIFIYLFINLAIQVDIKNTKFMNAMKKCRKVGSFIYLYHFQFYFYFYMCFDNMFGLRFSEYGALIVIPYILCVSSAFLLQTIFEDLSKYKTLNFLKYSY